MKALSIFPVLVVCLLSGMASAQNAPPPGSDFQGGGGFDQHKQRELARIQAHIAVLQTAANCIQAAPVPDALRGCREQERAGMQAVQQQFGRHGEGR